MQSAARLDEILQDQPEHTVQTLLCIRAWNDLSTERAVGWVVGPIPWHCIVAWCDFHGLDHDASLVLIHVIRALDNERAVAEAAARSAKNALGKRGAA